MNSVAFRSRLACRVRFCFAGYRFELIVVDDGSTDHSCAIQFLYVPWRRHRRTPTSQYPLAQVL
jgi:glycosyltransferase involved in cell wall biosynthesis